jgi:hypothetical protein
MWPIISRPHRAQVVLLGGGHEARAGEGVEHRLHLRNHAHTLAVELSLVLVGRAVVGGELICRDVDQPIDASVEGLARMISEPGTGAELAHVQQLVEDELQIAEVDQSGRHGAAVAESKSRQPPL